MALDLDDLIERIESGDTYREIAAQLGMGLSTLYRAIDSIERESSARARIDAAKQLSAEAWLDRGMAAIESSMDKKGDIDPSAARALAHECARRAGLRNPAYREQQRVEVQGTLQHSLTGGLSAASEELLGHLMTNKRKVSPDDTEKAEVPKISG